MDVGQIILSVLNLLLLGYLLTLWLRIGLDLMMAFVRDWRPKGATLVLAETAYTLTDPPLRALRRILPPLRLGPVALDFSVAITMLGVILLMTILAALLG